MTTQTLPLVPIREKVQSLYESIQDMQSEVSKILFDPQTIKNPAGAKRQAIERLDRQRAFNFAWVTTNILPAYNEAADRTRKRLLELGFKARKPKTMAAGTKRQAVESIIDAMNRAIDQVQDRVNEFFKLLKKSKTALLQNLSFGQEIEQGIRDIRKRSNVLRERTTKTGYAYQASMSRQEVQKEITLLFEEVFGDFNFIEITTKTGKTLHYKPDYYFKMLARTEMRDVQTRATIDLAGQWGCDLVQVSKHDSPCDVCKEIEENVYSLSGDDPDFEQYEEGLIPVHPNCEHNLNPVTRSYLRSAGVL